MLTIGVDLFMVQVLRGVLRIIICLIYANTLPAKSPLSPNWILSALGDPFLNSIRK